MRHSNTQLVLYALSFSLCFGCPAARAAAVATSSPYATKAAEDILKRGGTAADAACAAVFALGVAQSYFTGLGGGGFALVHKSSDAKHPESKSGFYDFREQAPAGTTGKLFSKFDPNDFAKINTGPQSVGIPGNVSGCDSLIRKYGRFEWKTLLQPAQALAQNGFEISQMYMEELAEQWGRLAPFELTRSIYQGKEGSGLKKGETLKQPLLAKTLETLGEKGADAFYKGEFAEAWLKQAQTLGVRIQPKDLAAYHAEQRSPVAFTFGTYQGTTAAAPSSAGYTVASVLRFLDHYQRTQGLPERHSLARYVSELEAFAYFNTLRDRDITDASRSKFSAQNWFGSKAEAAAWKKIDEKIFKRLMKMGAATVAPTPSTAPITPETHLPASKAPPTKEATHTAHISVVDDEGLTVALTSSLGAIYGSGITVPEFGFVLNSTLTDFDALAGKLNSPKAGMRPRSNMSPTILYINGQPVAAVGAAGGPLIPMAVVQFLQNYFVYAMSPQEAVQFPRASIGKDGKSVEIENKAGPILLDQLKRVGYQAQGTDTIWAVFNGVVRKDLKAPWEAVTESRYDGAAWVGARK